MSQRKNRSTRGAKIRREIYQGIAESELKNDPSLLDRLAFDMEARSSDTARCCSHHRKAVLRRRVVAAMGYRPSSIEEFEPLSGLPVEGTGEPAMVIIPEACNSCPSSSYVVTNACQNCVDRSCSHQCPRDAITFTASGAVIDGELCINCGKCAKACSFSAIIHRKSPCLDACPAGAIQREGDGPAVIHEEKCIQCGQCMLSCPFAAPVPVSHMRNVARELSSENGPVALVAPSVHGQLPGTRGQFYTGLRRLGFAAVYEVAEGAVTTAEHEARELGEHMKAEKGFMTSSCCPAYTELVRIAIPALGARVSSTPPPMFYSAREAAVKHPGHSLVFIGPCFAKKLEALRDGSADYVITVEELGAMLVAAEIELSDLPEEDSASLSRPPEWAMGFARAGGVAEAIAGISSRPPKIRNIKGLDKKQGNLLKAWSKKPELADTDFLEVMCCPGGCASGPGVLWENSGD